MIKLIFLDIDGVLNNGNHANWIHENVSPGFGFGKVWELDRGNINDITLGWDTRNVSVLKELVYDTNAKLVISSSWRIGRTTAFFRRCFKYYNFNPDIIGFTPVISKKGRIRGDEVNYFLNDKRYRDTARWVCIDDGSDFYPDNNLIKVDPNIGLTWDVAEKASKILKGS